MTLTRRHRQVLAVLAVTTALCADHVASAAPTVRPQVGTLAGRIVTRLTQSFGRTVAGANQVLSRQRSLSGRANVVASVAPVSASAPAHRPLSPFQFRLPPPTL